MANIVHVQSLDAPELDVFARLTGAQLRSRKSPQDGVFIAESPNVIALALRAGCIPRALLMEEKHIQGKAADIIAQCGDIPVYTGDSDLLASLTGFQLTRGVLCAMGRPLPQSPEEICKNARRLAVLDGIVDTTNMGAIFRSAAALHMDGVLLTSTCCDPLTRRSLRVGMGSPFQIPWAYLSEEPQQYLGERGFKTVAMALSDTAVSIDDSNLMAEDKLAIWLGTEGHGLAESVINGCDYTACIPMSHGVDSLNVAAASAVAFWQLRVIGGNI